MIENKIIKLNKDEIEIIVNNSRVSFEEKNMYLTITELERIERMLNGTITINEAKQEVYTITRYNPKSLDQQDADIVKLNSLKNNTLHFDTYFNELSLTNKFGIRNQDELLDIEMLITSLNFAYLEALTYNGPFDFELLKDIHYNLYNDIYLLLHR